MGNLVYAPHYTCGGLICDMLNQTWSPVTSGGGIGSDLHQQGKKLGDSSQIFTEFNETELIQILNRYPDSDWIGAHCYPTPGVISSANNLILVTTATTKSRIYRFARAYYHYFLPQWQEITGLELIDKTRETAKEYTVASTPLIHNKIYNLEFSDVVECTPEFQRFAGSLAWQKHISRWQQINHFLFDDFWSSPPVLRYYEAEYEVNLQRYYAYE